MSGHDPTPESILNDPNDLSFEEFTAKARDGEATSVNGSGKPVRVAFSQVVMTHPVRICWVDTLKDSVLRHPYTCQHVTPGPPRGARFSIAIRTPYPLLRMRRPDRPSKTSSLPAWPSVAPSNRFATSAEGLAQPASAREEAIDEALAPTS